MDIRLAEKKLEEEKNSKEIKFFPSYWWTTIT